MAKTLSIFNGFSKIILLLEREVNFQQNPYNTSHRHANKLPVSNFALMSPPMVVMHLPAKFGAILYPIKC